MNKLRRVIAVFLSISTFIGVVPSQAASVQKGQPCAKIGKISKVNTNVFKCELWGDRSYWVYVSGKGQPAFEVKYTKEVMNRVLRDLAESECRALDGIMVYGSLDLLTGNYERLADDVVLPPGVNARKWVPRLRTLADFSDQAADDWYYEDFVSGSSKLMVIKKETLPILKQINKAYGSKFAFRTITGC